MSDKKATSINSPKFSSKPDPFKRPLSGKRTLNMNATMLGPLGKQQDFANTTLHSFNPQPLTMKVDWEMECSLAYHSYLQAVMVRQLTQEAITNFEAHIDDQLTMKGELLLKQTREQRKLQNTITNGELLKEVVALVKDLKEDCEQFLKVNSTTGFDKHIQNLTDVFEDVSNRLYLKNIKLYDDEEEIEFLQSLKRCTEAILLFKKCVNYVDNDIENLLGILRQLDDEGRGAAKKQKLISDQLLRLSVLCFKKLAKKFSEIRLRSG